MLCPPSPLQSSSSKATSSGQKETRDQFLTLFSVLKGLEQSSPESSCPGEAVFGTAMHRVSQCMQPIQRASVGNLH